MNSNPAVRNPAHGAALENYRLAEAQLQRYINLDFMANANPGRMAVIEASPEYAELVEARDQARDAVAATEKPAPKAKQKARK